MEESSEAEAPKKRVVCGPMNAASSIVARGRKSFSSVIWVIVKSRGCVTIFGSVESGG